MNFSDEVNVMFFIILCINILGEAMEQGLRDCCRSIRIGKILIQSDEDTHEAHVVYAKFPQDIALRKVLLMYPIMSKYIFLSFVIIHYLYVKICMLALIMLCRFLRGDCIMCIMWQ